MTHKDSCKVEAVGTHINVEIREKKTYPKCWLHPIKYVLYLNVLAAQDNPLMHRRIRSVLHAVQPGDLSPDPRMFFGSQELRDTPPGNLRWMVKNRENSYSMKRF